MKNNFLQHPVLFFLRVLLKTRFMELKQRIFWETRRPNCSMATLNENYDIDLSGKKVISKLKIGYLSVSIFFLITTTLSAQEKDANKIEASVYLKNSTILKGDILEITPDSIFVINNEDQVIGVSRKVVLKISLPSNEPVESYQNEQLPYRYILSETAFPRATGFELNQIMTYLSLGYNGNKYSITAGTEWITAITENPALIVNSRLNYKITEFFWASGGLLTIFPIAYPDERVIVPKVNLTVGNKGINFTFGTYFAHFSATEFSVIYSLSGMIQVSKNMALVTDNYLFADDDFLGTTGFYTYGLRFFWPKVSLSLAMFYSPESQNEGLLRFGVPIPFLAMTIPLFKHAER